MKVSSGGSLSLFETRETEILFNILSLISNPLDSILISESILEKYSRINTLNAHKFLKSIKPNKITIEDLILSGGEGLFVGEGAIPKWGNVLKNWINNLSNERPSFIVSTIGNELLIDQAGTHEELLRNVEVVRSFIHLAILFEQKHQNAKLGDFLEYIERLKSYGTHIGLATFGSESGVQIMTLHKSKGLEYKAVWIAHMNEETLMSEKRNGFSLPEKIKLHIAERDIETAKRELYVAITRAKEYCSISYAIQNYNGVGMELASVIKNLNKNLFIKKSKDETEKEILENGPQIYTKAIKPEEGNTMEDLKTFVRENYTDVKVSVTLLNNFFECPWKWYFRNFLKLPEMKGVSLSLGSAVHSTIEFILRSELLPNMSVIKERIEMELSKEGVEKGAEFKKLSKDAEKAVVNWIDNYYKNLEKDRVPERKLQFRDPMFPELLMYGKLDLTERNTYGDITVTDFKTGSSKTKNIIEKIDEEGRLSSLLRQLVMYHFLIKGAEKGKEVSVCRLLFLEASKGDKNSLYSTNILPEQIDLLKKDISDYNNFLKSGGWTDRPCNYNSYGKNTECEYCKRATIYKL